MHLLSAKTKSSDLVEDLVGGLRPGEGLPFALCALTYARMASRSCGTLDEIPGAMPSR